MFVRFVKDVKDIKKNTIIKCNSIHGNSLIKKGLAVEEPRCFKIKDLCIAQYVRFIKKMNTNYVIREDYSIFTYNENSSVPGDSLERGIFVNSLTGEKYYPLNHKDRKSFPSGVKVVSKESKIPFKVFFYLDILANNLTENSYISTSDLVHFEYKARNHMRNNSKQNQTDRPIDYCNS